MIYTVTDEGIFGHVMCKFTNAVDYINMFSSIFLLVIISVDRCVSVVFPVWARNQRTVGKASLVVLLAWFTSVALSTRFMFSYIEISLREGLCYIVYKSEHLNMIVVSQFIGGFVIPFLIVFFCYSVIILRLRTNRRMIRSSKPLKLMTVLTVTFFICWLPYHVFTLLALNHQIYNPVVLNAGFYMGSTLAIAPNFLNPVIYVVMGNDIKQNYKISILSKIENAIREED